MVGTIDPQCEITPVVVQAYESARFLCEQYYLSAPAMEYTSYDGSTRYVFLVGLTRIRVAYDSYIYSIFNFNVSL